LIARRQTFRRRAHINDRRPEEERGTAAQPGLTRSWTDSDRLEAFSDGVMAVIITLMAFELRPPDGVTLHALAHRLPAILIYALSFITIGMSWNHHHQVFRAADRINGLVMWANLHLLFWLSLVPVVTQWVGAEYRARLPASAYGAVALAATVAYAVLLRTVSRVAASSTIADAIGSDLKGAVTVGLYLAGATLAWVSPALAYATYLGVALMWLLPDPRL
jgi:uncharacterized membrane protein